MCYQNDNAQESLADLTAKRLGEGGVGEVDPTENPVSPRILANEAKEQLKTTVLSRRPLLTPSLDVPS